MNTTPVREVSLADAAVFQTVRPRLFGNAYRVLGAASEADDVGPGDVDPLAGHRPERGARRRPRFSPRRRRGSRSTSRNPLAPAARRTSARGSSTPSTPQPIRRVDVEQREALESAVRTLLQKLSPAERAAYVLREAFDYPYRRISQVLALSEANARQLVTRARHRLTGVHRRRVGATEHRRLLDAFVAAAETGDLATLEQVLANSALVPATRDPVTGASLVQVAA